MGGRGGRGSTGKRLRFLVFVLLDRRGRVVLHLVDPLLELLDAAAERAGEIRQALGAEEDQHDHQNQQQLLVPQTKHRRAPFLLLTTPYTTRGPRPLSTPTVNANGVRRNV